MFASTTIIFLIALIGVLVDYPSANKTHPWKGPPPSKSIMCKFPHGTVVSDAAPCAPIGDHFLFVKRGSVMDAAIATLLCNGIVNMHSMGIGGGSFMNFYDKKTGSVTTIDSRETAPLKAYKDMFLEKNTSSTKGGLAIAVPGEVYGYYHAHKLYGKLPWADLFQPTIDLLRNGYPVNRPLADAIASKKATILKWSMLKNLLWNNKTNDLKTEGDLIYNPRLAKTLDILSREPLALYNGSLVTTVAREIAGAGGIINETDLKTYKLKVAPPVSSRLKSRGLTMYSLPPPSSGALAIFMLNILNGYTYPPYKANLTFDEVALFYHRAVEAMKFTYAKRSALGDQDFVNVTELVKNLTSNSYAESIREEIDDSHTHDIKYYHPSFDLPEDHGTTHINIVGENGDAVAVTSTINLEFGSFVMGEETGIIYNNEMDDFSTPNKTNAYGIPSSPSNYISPGKRPMSSMSPLILIDDNGDAQYLAGTSGGSRITSVTAMVLCRSLFLGDNIKEAIDYPRLHHQLIPDHIFFERDFPTDILEFLKTKGHKVGPTMPMTSCQGVQRADHLLLANADYRKGGSCDGY